MNTVKRRNKSGFKVDFHEEVRNVQVEQELVHSRRKWRNFWVKEYVLIVEVRQALGMLEGGPEWLGTGGQGPASKHCRGKGARQMGVEIKVRLLSFSLNKNIAFIIITIIIYYFQKKLMSDTVNLVKNSWLGVHRFQR